MRTLRLFVVLIGLVGNIGLSPAQPRSVDLEKNFISPPPEALPRVWWHWMNGNVTREGITADLEWMHRVGIGGFQQFDVNLGNFLTGETELPTYVPQRIVYRSSQWQALLQHTAVEAERTGLEMTIHAAAGWSEMGGPWVSPEDAMKKLVWSDTIVNGPGRFIGTLPLPPTVTGPFQELPRRTLFGLESGKLPTYYEDVAVVAYRRPSGIQSVAMPRLQASISGIDLARLQNGNWLDTLTIPVPADNSPVWIQFDYGKPVTLYALTLVIVGNEFPKGELQASEDGVRFRSLVAFPGQIGYILSRLPVQTYAFAPARARYFRLVLYEPPPPGLLASFLGRGTPPAYHLSELVLHAEPRSHRWEAKAGFDILFDYERLSTPPFPDETVIRLEDVVDLTDRLRPDGTLNWQIPEGEWVILRLGASLTGAMNNPAPPEGRGLEVDKLNPQAVRRYLETFMAPIIQALGPLVGRRLQYVLLDSWEAGLQNWTSGLFEEFRRRRGYSPLPYLPALVGRVVQNSEVTDRFLYDFRRTIAEMLAEHYYQVVDSFFAAHGMGVYAEAAGANNPMFQDALRNKGIVDIPMGEFWTPSVVMSGFSPEHVADIIEASSAAHIYGKPIIAAESFTTAAPGWSEPPAKLKPIADYYLALGVNRFVIHTSVHQPLDRPPGFTLGPFGQHFNRHTTWAELARGWTQYLARCSYLLQQGRYVADIAYFLGEGIPATVFRGEDTTPDPEPPEGYRYDFLNAEVLLQASVVEGRLVLPSGMRYAVLVLPDWVRRISLPVLRKLQELVREGVTLVGARPLGLIGLEGYPKSDKTFDAIVTEMWGDIDGEIVTNRIYGRGKIYWGRPLKSVLQEIGVRPDVEMSRPYPENSRIVWIHRQTEDGNDLYFVANQSDRIEPVTVRFRVTGKAAEVWNPVQGTIQPASYRIESEGTVVPLELGPYESVFVVFRQVATQPFRMIPDTTHTTLEYVRGPWHVSFTGIGAPEAMQMDSLISWTEFASPEIRYFSGMATYTTTIEVPARWLSVGDRIELDLGQVREVAAVWVNDDSLGVVWAPPFRMDITQALRPGQNVLHIQVANLWTNRLVGEALDAVAPLTFTTDPRYHKEIIERLGSIEGLQQLVFPSGLLGPVRLLRVSVSQIN